MTKEAKFEAVMQAEDLTKRDKTRIPNATQTSKGQVTFLVHRPATLRRYIQDGLSTASVPSQATLGRYQFGNHRASSDVIGTDVVNRDRQPKPGSSSPVVQTQLSLEVCVVCGVPLDGRRSDARHCGGPCRAEAARLRAILNGRGSGPYRSIESRLSARRRRTAVPSNAGNRPVNVSSGPEITL